MIALAVALAVASGGFAEPDVTDPTDWGCAQPLIVRASRQSVDSSQLSALIAERCARPFTPASADAGAAERERAVYRHRLSSFQNEIERRVERERRLEGEVRMRR